MSQKRITTKYPGVTYRYTKRLGNPSKEEKVFYIQYYYKGERIQERAGRQYSDDMTAVKASHIRSSIIEGHQFPRKYEREIIKQKRLDRSKGNLISMSARYIRARGFHSQWVSCRGHIRNYLQSYCGDQDLTKWKAEDTRKLRIWLEKKHPDKSPQTHKHILQTLQKIMRFNDIIIKFEMPVVFNETTEDLSPNEWQRLKDILVADGGDVAQMLLVISMTGARQGEVRKLTWDDVNFITNRITYKVTKNKTDHTVPMSEPLRRLLLRRWKLRGEDIYVFQSRKTGRQYAKISRAARRLTDQAGLPKDFRPCHGLRHWYGSELISKGASLYTVATMLNHSDIKITRRYAKVREKEMREAADLIAQEVTNV